MLIVFLIDLLPPFCPQLSVRRKNAKEMFGGFFKNMVKSADEVLISGIKVSLSLSFLHNMNKTGLLGSHLHIFDTGSGWVFWAGEDFPARLLQQDKRFYGESGENDPRSQKYLFTTIVAFFKKIDIIWSCFLRFDHFFFFSQILLMITSSSLPL